MDSHKHHESLFAAHQEALLHFQVTEASARLGVYRRSVLAHMATEESWILPLYQARGGERPGGTAELFLFEHAKLRRCLADIVALVNGLPAAPTAAAIIGVIDRECAYKNLWQHHDTRERTMLYPFLDSVTTEEEQASCLAHFSDESEVTQS